MDVRKILGSEYRSRFPEGDKLSKVAKLINWEAFKPTLEPLFKNTGEGRPHMDVVLMTKVLVLQSWYGLSDEQVERDCNDRLTFMNFLGYPSRVPDARTIWLFKERLAEENGKEKELWDELQRQLKRYRVAVKKGQMKDAVLIELGGWRQEGQHGPVTDVSPHTGFAQDSTIIGADPGLPTEEDVQKRKEIEEKKKGSKKEKEGEAGVVRPDFISPPKDTAAPPSPASATAAAVKTKPRGEKAKTTRSRAHHHLIVSPTGPATIS